MNTATFTKNLDTKTLTVERDFQASRDKVWKAFTQSEILEQWFAPKPWKAGTVSFDFSEGGHWRYFMAGPEGEKHYARFDYETIQAEDNYTGQDSFCDEAGEKNPSLPSIHWNTEFHEAGDTTKLKITMTFATSEDVEKIIQMGFQEGIGMGFDNLDALLPQL